MRSRSYAPGEKTDVEVRFEAVSTGTRVTIEHRGWSALGADHPAREGLRGDAFQALVGLFWTDLLVALRMRAEAGRTA